MITQYMQFVAIVVGSCLLGNEFGWQVGLGVGFIAYALMPAQAH